jgi:sterol desaturase/sphingolipid hydroxylase (fatty acid hydroxylase superfamily)
MPSAGHIGFDKLTVKGKFALHSDFFHYMHHRYFECNYGTSTVPFDRWFGTFHDGSPESYAIMQEKWGKNRA